MAVGVVVPIGERAAVSAGALDRSNRAGNSGRYLRDVLETQRFGSRALLLPRRNGSPVVLVVYLDFVSTVTTVESSTSWAISAGR
jgi:hypothetical protein